MTDQEVQLARGQREGGIHVPVRDSRASEGKGREIHCATFRIAGDAAVIEAAMRLECAVENPVVRISPFRAGLLEAKRKHRAVAKAKKTSLLLEVGAQRAHDIWGSPATVDFAVVRYPRKEWGLAFCLVRGYSWKIPLRFRGGTRAFPIAPRDARDTSHSSTKPWDSYCSKLIVVSLVGFLYLSFFLGGLGSPHSACSAVSLKHKRQKKERGALRSIARAPKTKPRPRQGARVRYCANSRRLGPSQEQFFPQDSRSLGSDPSTSGVTPLGSLPKAKVT